MKNKHFRKKTSGKIALEEKIEQVDWWESSTKIKKNIHMQLEILWRNSLQNVEETRCIEQINQEHTVFASKKSVMFATYHQLKIIFNIFMKYNEKRTLTRIIKIVHQETHMFTYE